MKKDEKNTKIKNILNTPEELEKIIKQYKTESHEFSCTLTGVPESYVRERKGKNHFYNPKQAQMKKIRDYLNSNMRFEDLEYLKRLLNSEEEYYIELNVIYYLPIQKSESIKNSVLKELGLVVPAKRPDLDNYDKFLLDTLHNVFYMDDAVVSVIHSSKRYSINPRTEFTIKIIKSI